MSSQKRSPKEDDRQLLMMYVTDEIRHAGILGLTEFETTVYDQAIRYVIADGYRHTQINFDNPELDLDLTGQRMLELVVHALRKRLPDLQQIEGSVVDERLDTLENHILHPALLH